MYVCLCNKVTDKQIKAAVREGADSLTDIMEQLDVATNCGTCAEHAQQVINETLNKNQALNFNLAYQAA